MVDPGKGLFADVAVLGIEALFRCAAVGDVLRLEAGRRKNVRGCKDGLPAQAPNAGAAERGLFPLDPFGLSATHRGFHHSAARGGIGHVHRAGGIEQAVTILGGHRGQQPAVGNNGLEQVGGRTNSLEEG